MTGIVVFDAGAFVNRYPEFTSVSAPTLQTYFDEATIYLDNTQSSPVSDLTIRATLLNMVTAHIAALNGNGNPAGLVGRVTAATQGSVSAQASYSNAVSGSMAWYIQTSYGASYWAATARYRTMRYRAPVRRC